MLQGSWIPGTGDISGPMQLRMDVFVKEQGFSEAAERDDKDEISWHLYITEDERPVATARIFAEEPGVMHVGRICVAKDRRGEGVGDLVMRLLIDRALQLDAQEVRLGAQKRVQPFYERYGFIVLGDEYQEEGVPHVLMGAPSFVLESLFGGCGGGCEGCSSCGHGETEEDHGE